MHYHYFTLEQRAALERVIRAKIAGKKELDDALQRLHGAEYGVCFSCDADIPYVQLEQRPLSRRCGRCDGA